MATHGDHNASNAPHAGQPGDDPLKLIVVIRRPNEIWPLTGRYVEEVWSELLGPTATMLARRIGHLTDEHPGTAVSPQQLATGLSSTVPLVSRALRRLHHYGLLRYAPEDSVIIVSGLAPSVTAERLATVSAATRARHHQLDLALRGPWALRRPPEGVGNGRTSP